MGGGCALRHCLARSSRFGYPSSLELEMQWVWEAVLVSSPYCASVLSSLCLNKFTGGASTIDEGKGIPVIDNSLCEEELANVQSVALLTK